MERDLIYGQGRIGRGRPQGPHLRPLRLDAYLPSAPPAPGMRRPALILAFGGAFHRGSKENDAFESDGGNTPIADYCRRFARRGYAAFSIDYRLVPEDPVAGTTPVIADPAQIPMSRVDVVRRLMNLPPATPEMLWHGIEAAADDMADAARFVLQNAARWQVDPGRVALGGFSAGARSALNAAFGERVAVAAVASLSGFMAVPDLKAHLRHMPNGGPAVLLVHAEHDLDYVAAGTTPLGRCLRDHGLHCETVRVPGATHFYRAEAVAEIDAEGAAAPDTLTVEAALDAFLQRAMPAGGAAAQH